jgi:hypothetical protein
MTHKKKTYEVFNYFLKRTASVSEILAAIRKLLGLTAIFKNSKEKIERESTAHIKKRTATIIKKYVVLVI